MPNKIKPTTKTGKCTQCGNKIKHHHKLCDSYWEQEKQSNILKGIYKK